MSAPKFNTAIMAQASQLDNEDRVDGVLILVEKLLDQADLNAWTIGDLINLAGATPANIELFRKMTGAGKSTLENYAYTARTWTPENRWQYLYDESGEPTVVKYNHLSALNSIVNDPEYGFFVALDAINKLADGYMTISEFKRYIAVNIRKNKPKPKRVRIGECEGFFWIDDDGFGNIQLSEKIGDMQQEDNYIIQVYKEENES